MNNFICTGCGTKYQSPELTPPPGIKWNDGHVCTPKLVAEEVITEPTIKVSICPKCRGMVCASVMPFSLERKKEFYKDVAKYELEVVTVTVKEYHTKPSVSDKFCECEDEKPSKSKNKRKTV